MCAVFTNRLYIERNSPNRAKRDQNFKTKICAPLRLPCIEGNLDELIEIYE